MIQFMIWLFRQRGKRANHYEETVIKDAFADNEWDGKMNTLRKRIEAWNNPCTEDHLGALGRLIVDYKSYD